jgi:YbgC/YbaW family acyl-CoA thioester hydrolase
MREVKLQTYWADSDPAGIVYFPHFFRFIEQAEEELYLQVGTKRQILLDRYSIWMPRVEAHVNFVSPIRNGHAIRVLMDPQFKGQKTVRFEFEIFDPETSTHLAAGYMTAVCVDRANFKATPIPEEVRSALEGNPGTSSLL